MKSLLFLLLFVSSLFCDSLSDKLRVDIVKNIVLGIKNSEPMTVCSDDVKIMKAFHSSEKFKVVDDCNDAKLIVLSKKPNLPKDVRNKHIFVLDYDLLNEIPESFGAFFWKKGRPNVVFIKPRIQKHSLKLSANLKPYVEDKIW